MINCDEVQTLVHIHIARVELHEPNNIISIV